MKKKFVEYADLFPSSVPTRFDRIGKVSAESVLKHTGKDWKAWIERLEHAGARTWSYQEIVAFLRGLKGVSPWWAHGIAMGFEIAIGRRLEGQDAKGNYMVTATKNFPFEATELWQFLASREGLDAWLMPLGEVEIRPETQFETRDGYFGEIRTVKERRRIRLFWQEASWPKHTVVEMMVVPRSGGKSILIFNHTAIASPRIVEILRQRWKLAISQILLDTSKMTSQTLKGKKRATKKGASGKAKAKASREPGSEFSALSQPAQRALASHGIRTPKDLARRTLAEVLKFHGVGPASVPILQKILRMHQLKFRG